MTEAFKSCVTCKHCDGAEAQPYLAHVAPRQDPQCKNPQAATLDPVYGRTGCRTERNAKNGCGKQGKLWEAK